MYFTFQKHRPIIDLRLYYLWEQRWRMMPQTLIRQLIVFLDHNLNIPKPSIQKEASLRLVLAK